MNKTQTYIGNGEYRDSTDPPGWNWRDDPDAVAELDKAVEQYEVCTLTMARDWSWSGPFTKEAAEAHAAQYNHGSFSSQVLLIPDDTK